MRKIEVVNYNPVWIKIFQYESETLIKVLGSIVIRVYHIGSTSIPGMAAKPTIDIILEVESINELDQSIGKMINIGYVSKGEYGIPGRRYFEKGDPNHTHHVHAFEKDDPNIQRHLRFRNYLTEHTEIAKQYSLLKINLSKQFSDNIDQYCNGKNDFIKYYEQIAEQDAQPEP
jgi:GrpB-like predicted nucleotidyltransferase (UPF0157 family)